MNIFNNQVTDLMYVDVEVRLWGGRSCVELRRAIEYLFLWDDRFLCNILNV